MSSAIAEMAPSGLSYHDQYLAMAFAHLTYYKSLRDIEACLGAMCGKLYHMGFRGHVTRLALGDAKDRPSAYPDTLRRVSYLDAVTGKRLVYF